jgi:membrane peptidoglycan carboxypeptidase
VDTTGSTSSFDEQEPQQPAGDQAEQAQQAEDVAQPEAGAADVTEEPTQQLEAATSHEPRDDAWNTETLPGRPPEVESPDAAPATPLELETLDSAAPAPLEAEGDAAEAAVEPATPGLDDGAELYEEWAPFATVPWLPPTPEQLRAQVSARRTSRRRRRYSMFVRRTSRARSAARSATVARAAWATAIIAVLLILSVLSTTVGLAAGYYQSELAQIKGLRQSVVSQDSLRIYDSTGTLLYELRDAGFQHSIDIAHVPITVINATVAIEDHDFWVNNGVDYTSIIRAALADVQSNSIQQGASTITQQLIKSQLLHDNSPDFSRKVREAILAVGITSQGIYSKQDILNLYLNSIGYSPTSYGIDAAAQEYFSFTDDPRTGMTAAQHLDLAQASMLAGIPQNPNLNDPLNNFPQAHQRQAEVLAAMVQYGYITQALAVAAYNESARPGFFHPNRGDNNLAPHFVYYVIQQLQSMIASGQLTNLSRSGLNVYTTLNLDIQSHVQQIMQQHVSSCSEPTGYSGYVMCEAHVTNAASVMVDQHTGAIRVLLGSVNYNSTTIDGKFDVATEGWRGPGSSFKPLVYTTAFEKGWFPAATVSDMPTPFWDAGAGKTWKPTDYTRNEFSGEITLRRALQWSLNIPAVKVMQFAGVQDVMRNIQRWGITQWQGTPGLSTVLGTLQVHPIDLVQAYTVLANYGQYIPLYAIDRITDSSGNALFQYHVPQPVQVLDPRLAFLTTNVLSDNAARAGDFGGCSFLYLDPANNPNNPGGECNYLYGHNFVSPRAWPAAAKTGTGSDFKDDWTMGYTMDLTMGVWVGNNDDTDMVHVDGIHGAAPIWNRAMLYAEAHYNYAKTPFPMPLGVHRATYTSNGITSTDWFLNGPTPPPNIGTTGPSSPGCIQFPDTGGWDYASPPNCAGTIIKTG